MKTARTKMIILFDKSIVNVWSKVTKTFNIAKNPEKSNNINDVSIFLNDLTLE